MTKDDFPYALTMLRFDTPGVFRGRSAGEDLAANGVPIPKSEVFDERQTKQASLLLHQRNCAGLSAPLRHSDLLA